MTYVQTQSLPVIDTSNVTNTSPGKTKRVDPSDDCDKLFEGIIGNLQDDTISIDI